MNLKFRTSVETSRSQILVQFPGILCFFCTCMVVYGFSTQGSEVLFQFFATNGFCSVSEVALLLRSRFSDLKPVQMTLQQVPESLNWAEKGWTSYYRTGAFAPNGWVFSAVKSVESRFFNITGD